MDSIALAAALNAADGGDFRPVAGVLARIGERDDLASRAAKMALDLAAQLADVGREDEQAIRPEILEQCIGAPVDVRAVAQWACVYFEKRALLRFDDVGLQWVLSIHERLLDAEPLSRIRYRLGRAWHAVVSGAGGREADELESLARDAREAKLASVVVEATSLRALCLASTGNVESALDTARRGSRMARTEGLPQSEYLANIILARLRRLTDRPHLATRILSALAGFVSSPWHLWLRWELVMASGHTGDAHDAHAYPHPIAELVECLRTATAGDYPRFSERVISLSQATHRWTPLFEDVARLRAALDFSFDPPDWCNQLRAFRAGEVDGVPFGLDALNRDSGLRGQPSACVVGFPEGGVRVIHAGSELAIAAVGAARLPATRAATGRTDTLLAALALAGSDGLTDAAAFRAVYGFAFAKNVHQSAFNVVVHRARQRLDDAGEIEHQGGSLRLRLRAPLVIADPRCTSLIDERVLQVLAQTGTASAQTVSEALDVPLRRVQDALKQLVDLGACAQETAEGRQYKYRVEDTTFLIPTRFR